MHIRTRSLSVVTALTAFISCQPAMATNGYMAHGIGAKNKAMAGAGMALPQAAMSVVNNPASAALLGETMDAGISAFMPRRNFTSLFGGNNGRDNSFSFENVNIDSGEDLFFSPEIAGTHLLPDGYSLAWAFYMRTGLASSFKGGSATFDPDFDGPMDISTSPGIYGDGTAEFELSQAFVDIALASTFGDSTAFGVSVVLAAQSLEVKGMGGFARYTETFAASAGADYPDKLSGNGRDVNYGAGLKAGLHRKFGERVSLAASYWSKINVGSHGDYADLFAGGGELDIPARAALGLTWQPSQQFSLSLDMQYISYSSVEALGNSFAKIYDCPSAGFGGADQGHCLGGSDGPGLGWDDMPVVSIGSHWDVNDSWTLRAGFSIGDQPVTHHENTFNIPIISLTETHYTFGISRRLANGDEVSFSFMYTEEESLEDLNQLDNSQVLRLTTDQFDFQLSYAWGLN